MRCLMPIAASPASYIPGVSLARGSLASEPVIPTGRGGAGSGANGFPPPFWLAGFVSGAFVGSGDGDGVCACVGAAKHDQKTREAMSKRKAMVVSRFIVSPLRFFPQHGLHNPDLSALATVDIRRKIEQFGILPRTRSVAQVFHHNQGAVVVLNHPCQK